MKTSVVMATYNGETYLREQLDSLRNQSREIDEVIFLDDKSKDCTVSQIKDYITHYSLENRWKVYVNEHNLGYADNFHKVLQMATGDYIFFSDQDDVWYPEKIEIMVDVMESNEKIGLLCTDYDALTSTEDAPSVSAKASRYLKKDDSIEYIELNSKNIYIASLGCVMGMTKGFRDRIEPYWKNGWAHDDFVWRMAQCLDACYIYHRPMIQRRLHDHNVSMNKMHTREQRLHYFQDLYMATSQMYAFAKELSIDEKKIRLLDRHLKAAAMRIELMRDRKVVNFFKLLPYLDCYYSKKSVLMDPYIALKRK